MKLKNTDELRRRAKAHRRMQNFQPAGGYGVNAAGGDPREIEACGIGCLAAPHTKRAFSKLIAKIGLGEVWDPDCERKRLEREFGISWRLSWVIERGFESEEEMTEDNAYGERTEDERASFIVAVAEAMADGVDIDPRSVLKWDDVWMPREDREAFLRWLAAKCGRPVPAYAREIVTA